MNETNTRYTSLPVAAIAITDTQMDFNQVNDEPDTLCQKSPCKVIKPLIPLKIALFFWYGGATSFLSFFILYFKQRGLSIAQISLINIISPFFQCFGPTISGVIADKIGRSKPVLFVNLLLILIATNCILLIPNVSVKEKVYSNITISCEDHLINEDYNNTFVGDTFSADCIMDYIDNPFYGIDYDGSEIRSPILCSFTEVKAKRYTILLPKGDLENSKLYLDNAEILFANNVTSMWCHHPLSIDCNLICSASNGTLKEDNTPTVFMMSLILILLFFTTLSNTYRFMDVTSMSMVKSYKSDFGRERIWAIIGTVLLAPLTGYLVEKATPINGPKNIVTVFYVFDGILVLVLCTVWKLNVRIDPPGKDMWKKTIVLLKNPDILAFCIVLLVLGTAGSFYHLFSQIFLDSIGATSMLFALQPAVNSILGIPFLYTSNWWVKKVGSTNLILCALVSYTVMLICYSFLIDPWWALSLEIFRVFTYHLLWVSVVRYSHVIAPEGLTATVISTAGGIHYALGKGTGSLIGGLTMSKYGGPWAYRLLALICSVTAIVYSMFLYSRRRWYSSASQQSGDEPKDIDFHSLENNTNGSLSKKESHEL